MHPCYDREGDAAIRIGGSCSKDKGGAGDWTTGVCAGEYVSRSEEATMAGGLWPPGMVTMEVMEEADVLFRLGL